MSSAYLDKPLRSEAEAHASQKHKETPDFKIENHGSIILFRPITKEAREWLDFNCTPEPWQWFGGALAVEPRCAPDIHEGLVNDGFVCKQAP